MSDFEKNNGGFGESEERNNSQQNYYQQPEQNTTYHYSYGGEAPDNQQQEPVKTKKKSSKAVIIIVVVLILSIILAIAGIFISSNEKSPSNNGENDKPSQQVQTEEQGDVPKTDNKGNYTVAGIAESCIDSCVGITVYTQANSYNNFNNYGSGSSSSGENVKIGEGSGIIMQESGDTTYILTCAHVISDGSAYKVTLNNGETYDAAMVGADAQTDIGVIAIKATGLKIAKFANSDSTVLGEQVVAIGCPGGLNFMNSVTSGYVSALARPVSSKIGYDTECIQIDAAINPGNSGGALFNMSGQVIGVNSSKIASTDYEGMGFAVPSNTALATANSLIKVGYVEGRAKIGITYKNIAGYSNSAAILSALDNLGFENAKGTMVINTINDDCDLAGKDVKEYDMIIAVNGDTLTSTDVMISILADSKPGDSIKLTIARIVNDQIKTFEVDCKLIEAKG